MAKGFPAKVWREGKRVSGCLDQKGKLLHFTKVNVAGEGCENLVPYVVGLIKVNGQVVEGRIVDWEQKEIKKGVKLEAVARRLRVDGKEGLIKYGICWRMSDGRKK
ncbi:MAG TPA: OB-fold domain-containing protein [Nevskiaceae bacterium]|nr:OB-fold domain-containing protein [Nevskiaceae bacterium]